MFSANGILGRNFSIMTAGMDGLAMRQRVHTENLANVNTDGYRARTVDFESTLASALDEPTGANPMDANGAALPSGPADAVTGGELASKFTVTTQPGAQGVDRVGEVNAMMVDNIRFRILSQQVTNRISELKSVISEMGRA